MTRYPNGLAGPGPFPASAPSEALLFARAITGNPLLGSAIKAAGTELDCEYLEWLAGISPEHERRLRNLAKAPQGDQRQREQLEWLADISPEHARQLREVQREEAIAAEVRERATRILERLEHAAEIWDASKHPRAGGPPNAGWFASTGGSAGLAPLPANPSPRSDALSHSLYQRDELAQAPPPAATTAAGAADDPQFAVCFGAGTPVLTRRGSVAIERVVAGDEAWSVPENDPLAAARWCRVEQAFHNAPAELINVNAVGLPVIRSTPSHKFYVRGKGFIPAADLKPGDLLRTADGWVPLTGTFSNGEIEPVFNVCVEGYHTYFAGDVLVHNDSLGVTSANAAQLAAGINITNGVDVKAAVGKKLVDFDVNNNRILGDAFVIRVSGSAVNPKNVEVVQFISRTASTSQSAKFRKAYRDPQTGAVLNGRMYLQGTAKSPNWILDNASTSTVTASKGNPAVVRANGAFVFYDAPTFGLPDVAETATLETFILIGGKVVYEIHWQRAETAQGVTSYPASNTWGRPVSAFPNWALRTLSSTSKQRAYAPDQEPEVWTRDPDYGTAKWLKDHPNDYKPAP